MAIKRATDKVSDKTNNLACERPSNQIYGSEDGLFKSDHNLLCALYGKVACGSWFRHVETAG